MNSLQQYGPLVARIFLAAVFILAGIGKIGKFDAMTQFIESAGLPFASVVLVLTIVIEIVGGLMLIVGYKVRFAASVLFVFALLTALIFHFDFSAPKEMFLKDIAIAGGMLLLMIYGAGSLSCDNKKRSGASAYKNDSTDASMQ